MCVITESAIVWISKCLNQQTSFQSQQMAGVAKISKCLSQQMSRPSQQMSNQQMSVSKCPVSKWKITKVPDTACDDGGRHTCTIYRRRFRMKGEHSGQMEAVNTKYYTSRDSRSISNQLYPPTGYVP